MSSIWDQMLHEGICGTTMILSNNLSMSLLTKGKKEVQYKGQFFYQERVVPSSGKKGRQHMLSSKHMVIQTRRHVLPSLKDLISIHKATHIAKDV